jgi:hypothetical protein
MHIQFYPFAFRWGNWGSEKWFAHRAFRKSLGTKVWSQGSHSCTTGAGSHNLSPCFNLGWESDTTSTIKPNQAWERKKSSGVPLQKELESTPGLSTGGWEKLLPLVHIQHIQHNKSFQSLSFNHRTWSCSRQYNILVFQILCVHLAVLQDQHISD